MVCSELDKNENYTTVDPKQVGQQRSIPKSIFLRHGGQEGIQADTKTNKKGDEKRDKRKQKGDRRQGGHRDQQDGRQGRHNDQQEGRRKETEGRRAETPLFCLRIEVPMDDPPLRPRSCGVGVGTHEFVADRSNPKRRLLLQRDSWQRDHQWPGAGAAGAWRRCLAASRRRWCV